MSRSEPQSFGQYTLLQELGRGGQGTVWLAEDRRLKRKVALKVLQTVGAVGEDRLRRFRREAEAASKLDHPHICALIDVGEVEGLPYLAYRYVEGETLAERIARAYEKREGFAGTGETDDGSGSDPDPGNRQGIERIVRLFEKTARALHRAHEQGLIHRDIKPGNVMVTPEGEPVVLDFGLARDELADEHTLTHSGDLIGTPAYMSPEQLMAQRIPIDRRTDVYSLGATLYECLVLQKPFTAPTRAELYHRILHSEPTSVSGSNRQIPRDLQIVVETAMEKDRNRRYQTALDFAEDLRRVREFERIRARPIGRMLRLKRWAQRRPAAAAGLAFLLVLLIVSLAFVVRLQVALRYTKGAALANAAATTPDHNLRLLLAREATRVLPDHPATRSALLSAFHDAPEETILAEGLGAVRRIALSGDREQLAIAAGGDVCVLDLADGSLRTLVEDEGVVRDVAFSTTHVLAASNRGWAYLFEAAGDRLVGRYEHGSALTAACFRPGADEVVLGSEEGEILFWDPRLGEVARTLAVGRAVDSLAVSADGRILAAAARGAVLLWSLDGLEPVAELPFEYPDIHVWRVRFAADGQHVFGCAQDRTVRAWTIDGELLGLWRDSGAPVNDIAVTADGSRILAASADQSIRLMTRNGDTIHTTTTHGGQVWGVEFLDEERYVSGSADGTIRVTRMPHVKGIGGHVIKAAFSSDTGEVLAAGRSGEVVSWDLLGPGRRTLVEFDEQIASLACAARSPRFVVSTRTHLVLCTLRGEELFHLRGDYVPRVLLLSGDGHRVVHSERIESQWCCVIRDEAGEILHRQAFEAIHGLAFSPDQATVFVMTNEGIVAWDPGRPPRVLIGPAQPLAGSTMAVSDPGGLIATAYDRNNAVGLWTAGGSPVRTLLGHASPVLACCFSRDGSLLFTGSRDGTIGAWRVTGEHVATLSGHRGIVNTLDVSADGRLLISGSADGNVRVWQLAFDEIGTIVDQRLAERSFSAERLEVYRDLLGDRFDALVR